MMARLNKRESCWLLFSHQIERIRRWKKWRKKISSLLTGSVENLIWLSCGQGDALLGSRMGSLQIYLCSWLLELHLSYHQVILVGWYAGQEIPRNSNIFLPRLFFHLCATCYQAVLTCTLPDLLWISWIHVYISSYLQGGFSNDMNQDTHLRWCRAVHACGSFDV